MDKYTVDLDQVLNDFEFSELTDQHHNTFDENRAQNTSQTGYNYDHYKNTNAKHSMNNVFHSLNEYLSTDIGTSAATIPKIDHNQVTGEPKAENARTEAPHQGVYGKYTADLRKTIDTQLAYVTNDAHIQANGGGDDQTIESQLTKGENDVLRADIRENCVAIDSQLIQVENETDIQQNDVINEKTIDENVENVVSCTEIQENGVDEHENQLTEVDNNKLCTVIEENGVSALTNEIVEIDANNKMDELVITKNDEMSINEKTDDNFDTKMEINSFNNDVNQIENGETLTCEKQNGGDRNDCENNCEQTGEAKSNDDVTTIGFSADLEIDENELYNELEQLYMDDIRAEIDDVDDDVDEMTSSSQNRPSMLEIPETSLINLVGEPGSTPYNNVYVTNELPTAQKNDVTASSPSPTFSDVSSDTTTTTTSSSVTPSTETLTEPQIVVAPMALAQIQNNENDDATNVMNDLGRLAPIWIPDGDALNCQHCDAKFTVLKRRHHCRACGLVLCAKCCNLKHYLYYMDEVARVCLQCYSILSANFEPTSGGETARRNQPNPSNPLEYCSTVPPHRQVVAGAPPSVLVPVGVLKRSGSAKGRAGKSVMFCDGIRPGSDLTRLDGEKEGGVATAAKGGQQQALANRVYPCFYHETKSFIPKEGDALPPIFVARKNDFSYSEVGNGVKLVEQLRNETITFALQVNLTVSVKISNLDCCINKMAWCFTTDGLINVGQDEIIILLELLDDESTLPYEIFHHLNQIYLDAVKGQSIKELGISLNQTSIFLGSKNHAGFVYIRPTFQCLQNLIKPTETFLIGILIHRWETPWAKLFPLRLILRLGAEYRYYPSPIISNRYRDSVYVEIGHTIINLLADFRNYSYSLPQIRGLTIHMEEKNTTVTIPKNRYDQVMKSMSNSSDHILAFAGHFSAMADSHLVCIQDTQSNENAYSTHAINIHNKPRKITGASFIVFNGALKSSSGLTAKSSIVEDGLMIQVPSEQMTLIRDNLRNMKNHVIQCGVINAISDESVNIVWGEPDANFNLGVVSPIDGKSMEGIPSIRVHNGKDFVNGGRLIRWTEVFIIEEDVEGNRNQDPIDISKVSETIAKATCAALVKYLDLLVSNNFNKICIRAHIGAFSVGYTVGSNLTKLPPIYMESLDNELVPILHRYAKNDCDENKIVLELVFRILNK